MNKELKPCKFCNSTDLVVENYWIECANCEAVGPSADRYCHSLLINISKLSIPELRKISIDLWNGE